MMKYKVYFGTHMMGQRWHLVTARAKSFRTLLGDYTKGSSKIELLLPFRDIALCADAIVEPVYSHPTATDQAITQRDRNDIKRSDAVLFYAAGCGLKTSTGMLMEMAWADAFGVPYILYRDEEQTQYDYPMIRATAAYIVHSVEDAARCLNNLLGV